LAAAAASAALVAPQHAIRTTDHAELLDFVHEHDLDAVTSAEILDLVLRITNAPSHARDRSALAPFVGLPQDDHRPLSPGL
jgi:hypothetical protein